MAHGFTNIFGLIIPTLMKDWNLQPAQVGLLGSWGMFGMIFGSLAFGPLADSIGKKHSILIGTAIYVIFTTACGFVHSFNAFAICRFIAGFALAGIFPLAVAFTSEYSPKPIRSRLTVWVTSGMAVGTVIAALAGMALIGPYGWRAMFYVSAIMILLLLGQAYLPESIAYLKKKGQNQQIGRILERIDPTFKATEADDYQLEAKDSGKGTVANLFKGGYAKNTVLFWIIMMCSYIFIYGVLMWLPKLMTMKGFSIKGSLFFTMTWNLGFILGIPLFGYLSDKIGGRNTTRFGWVVLAILVSLIGFMNNAIVLTILLFFTGAFQHGVSGAMGSYLAQSYPTSFRATGTTWGYGLGRIGGTAGPIIGGFLVAQKMHVGYNLMCFASLLIIAAILVSFTTDFFKKPEFSAAPQRNS
ncbi:MFS transporter [Holophaga foetida]|uniref:MFS transporter n=1 Tax=Holophaga foetida TaxID=35839 RepID=UPI000247497A|nr:MFS transporter [Holophaga foetida]